MADALPFFPLYENLAETWRRRSDAHHGQRQVLVSLLENSPRRVLLLLTSHPVGGAGQQV